MALDKWIAVVFLAVSLIYGYVSWSYPLLLIGFILGGMMEDNFARAVYLTDGVAFMVERPMTLALLLIGALLIVVPAWRRRRARLRRESVAD